MVVRDRHPRSSPALCGDATPGVPEVGDSDERHQQRGRLDYDTFRDCLVANRCSRCGGHRGEGHPNDDTLVHHHCCRTRDGRLCASRILQGNDLEGGRHEGAIVEHDLRCGSAVRLRVLRDRVEAQRHRAEVQKACGEGSLGLHRGHQDVQGTLTAVLSTSHDEGTCAWSRRGQNLTAVATDVGVAPASLVNALVSAADDPIDSARRSGELTAAQAAEYRAALKSAFEFRASWNGSDATPTFTGI